ncbi:MAG: endonuclease III [Ignavibacteriales bacterium]|nr:endonuclease III [Ignavibacteriales bacterium]
MARSFAAHPLRIRHVVEALERLFGTPAKQRKRSNPLDTLIATLLSQNTNDQNSYRAWLSLRKQFSSWKKVASASPGAIARSIKVGGLKDQKAQRIREILRLIHEKRGAYELDFLRPMSNEETMSYLMSMKGVGTKTAACVLVFSLGRDVFPVDTHIHRICNRLGLVKTNTADDTFEAMKNLIPKGRAYSFHVNLIRFGRETCKAIHPLCGECSLFEECLFREKERHAGMMNTTRGVPKNKSGFLITEQIARDHGR